MENMEPQIENSTEITPRSFFEKIQVKTKQVLLEMKTNLSELKEGALEMPPAMKTIREGNFSDNLRVELHVKTITAKKFFEELPEKKNLSREDFHNRQGLAKFVEFYELQEEFFARLAEVRDDPDLNEIALIMWSELQETYAKCMSEFIPDSSQE